ncbi:GNAT family N-acetyltransferase [Mucilaginibacter sp. L3T2-6]|uniref:GNAT family N-acetyltransferase n=1 Tax=Mucilaginibacter sp. L3T2-6 TaxID=3062491 RepID=UPI002676E584|nr:GNAT family N-acetyltransferase [Mucilaginibacter sp. L3T2-6]MDO3643593.1 GNAT family N-acetyltransferase [Mucilaginibacter sp. L3T2-6]MDV6216159.1 GNAT family N-acetyltransferase [Mucilaginibacter sp. L3T2-6]
MEDLLEICRSHLRLNRVTVADLNELVQISNQTYFETFFEAFNDPDAYYAYANEAFSADRLEKELTEVNTAFYFARVNGVTAGYIKINYPDARAVLQDNPAAELERIYVLSGYHHHHIGKTLLTYAIYRAKSKGFPRLWLAVWEHNHKAIRFYERNGFTQFATHNYQVAGDPQTDLLMHIMLNTPR